MNPEQLTCLLWNVQGISSKLDDSDFISFITKYDLLFFTESWISKTTPVSLLGYECIKCPRPKYNSKAKRNSGGVLVYYKQEYSRYLSVAKVDPKGLIWLKLSKCFLQSENDVFICVCYIPPEDSSLYNNINSELFQFDFYEYLSSEVRVFSSYGQVFILGDFNARTGDQCDYINDLNLDRYIDLPCAYINNNTLPVRKNHDISVNSFGQKLLSFCRENDCCILNGRLEEGQCTYHSHYKGKPVSSTVDYLIVDHDSIPLIQQMNVLELTEFSDHCPVSFSLKGFKRSKINDEPISFDKIKWDSSNLTQFHDLLNSNASKFDSLSDQLKSGDVNINDFISYFTSLVHDISFQSFGKNIQIKNHKKHANTKQCPWFDNKCKEAKRQFYRIKSQYKHEKTEASKLAFLQSRAYYCKIKRISKSKYMLSERNKLSNLSKNSPRQFWSYINKFSNKKGQSSNNVELNDFVKQFSNLNTLNVNASDNAFSDITSDQRDTPLCIDQLDSPFTTEEIKKTIISLKRNKSADLENIVSDFFIDSIDFIAPHLVTLFNNIFDSGIYPESWSKGSITPIFKKGDPSNPSNYRAITIVNTLSKIFSLTLRNRLNKWSENESILNDVQFGFRDRRSTTDAIFILHSLIQKIISKRLKLWCAFIDFERAFDTVNREALWHKLLEIGISCKMLTMLKAIYSNVKSCIKLNMQISDFFDVTEGLKQGEPLSPLLFLLFINDITKTIDFNQLDENDLNFLSIYLILFADDIVLFTTNPLSLQHQLDNVQGYSIKWGLKINKAKTKICVFRKGHQPINEDIFIENEKIEIVNDFVYLGLRFNYNGNLNLAVKCLQDQALRAYHNLLGVFDRLKLDLKCKLSLFDAMVVPIILYGSEVWGVYNVKCIEKLHIRFCKYLLGVSQQTPNYAVYGELGRLPLYVLAKQRAIKYFLKIINSHGSLIKHSYLEQINTISGVCWSSKIKSIMDHLGYGYLTDCTSTNVPPFSALKSRLHDQFVQDWSSYIRNAPKLSYYCNFKTDFKFEMYLTYLSNDHLRKQITCIRLSSHPLEIEVGRRNGIDRNDRLCKLCNMKVIESEYHFILCCPKYKALREKHLGNIRWPNLNMFYKLMSSTNNNTLTKLSKYIKEALETRKLFLSSILT